MNNYSEGQINHAVLGDSAPQYATVIKLLDQVREKFGVGLESKKAWLGLKSVSFVPKSIATNLKDALIYEQRQYQNTLNWISKHDYDNQNDSGIMPEFRMYQDITAVTNANTLWSQLVGANEETGFEKDELWQSCALKVLEDTLLSSDGGIDTTLQTKINTIVEQGNSDAIKYSELASHIASLIFQNLNKYVKPSEEFGEKFSEFGNTFSELYSLR